MRITFFFKHCMTLFQSPHFMDFTAPEAEFVKVIKNVNNIEQQKTAQKLTVYQNNNNNNH